MPLDKYDQDPFNEDLDYFDHGTVEDNPYKEGTAWRLYMCWRVQSPKESK